ncbi:hypothetical protein D046_2572C, partial [Vibrio parahaemolyticus V-223/04]
NTPILFSTISCCIGAGISKRGQRGAQERIWSGLAISLQHWTSCTRRKMAV